MRGGEQQRRQEQGQDEFRVDVDLGKEGEEPHQRGEDEHQHRVGQPDPLAQSDHENRAEQPRPMDKADAERLFELLTKAEEA